MSFQKECKQHVLEIEQVLVKYLPKEEGWQKKVIEAMNYSVLAGGKRLRPMLMQETYRLFGGQGPIIEPFMAAIEMIHTYSLVHDDLPAMDNDEYRRGRKTTHAVYGEAMGILAGDGLLNYAFETAVKAFDLIDDAAGADGYRQVGEALAVLGKKAGIYGMIGGQTADVEAVDQRISQELLDFIFRLKTGALMEASMMIGAILAGASQEDVRTVEQIAAKVGVAFQIQDDVLDVTSTTEELGKPVHSDEKNNKPTYVTMNGLEKSMEDVQKLSYEAMQMLEGLDGKNPYLKDLLQSLISRKK